MRFGEAWDLAPSLSILTRRGIASRCLLVIGISNNQEASVRSQWVCGGMSMRETGMWEASVRA